MRRLRRRTVVLLVLGVVVLWAGVVAYLLLDARAGLVDGRRDLEAARAGATPATLLDPATRTRLAAAEDAFSRARSRLRNPLLTPLRVLPVAGRHVRAGDRVAATALGSARLASAAIVDLQALADRPLGAGPERLALLDDLADLEARTAEGLAELDPGSPDHLVGPLGDAVAALGVERRQTLDGLAHAEDATRALRAILAGPTPYLLVGANNAEMRAGSGMFLSAASLSFDQGALSLGEVRSSAEVVLPAGTVPVTGDLQENWGWLDLGRDLRSLALSADFPQSAPVAAANWAQVSGGAEVAGVIVVDVDALRGLLAVVGPVEVDGIEYTADSVRGELLRDQYTRSGDDVEGRDERRDQLGDVAGAVFDRIEAGTWEFEAMATALTDAVQRRHLLVWSADPAAQEAWAAVGADGALREDTLAVSLINRGAEKLDLYLDTAGEVASSRLDDGRIRIDVTYAVTNRAPATGPRYQVGPNVEGLEAGDHRAIVSVNLPAGSADVRLDGVGRQILTGADGPTLVVAGELDVARGTTATVTVSAVLPRGVEQVQLEPSARIPRTVWTVDGETYELDRRRTLALGG